MSRLLVTILWAGGCSALVAGVLAGCASAAREDAIPSTPSDGAARAASPRTLSGAQAPHSDPDPGVPAGYATAAQAAVEPAVEPDLEPDLPRRDLALPRGWEALPVGAFEETLAAWNPEGAPARLSQGALDQLARALDGDTPTALRAVLLLAASASPEACDVLAARLDRRLRSATGAFPAVDVAAAAALAREVTGAPTAKRADGLYELAVGRRPHPLLPVRVECAASSLALGRENATKLLLAVLREGTPSQTERPSYSRASLLLEDLAFAQWRAADALTRHAGIANGYRPEQSAFERERIADEIERALAARGRDDSLRGQPARASSSLRAPTARSSNGGS